MKLYGEDWLLASVKFLLTSKEYLYQQQELGLRKARPNDTITPRLIGILILRQSRHTDQA